MKVTLVKKLKNFTLNKGYEVFISNKTLDFKKEFLISDNGIKMTFDESLIEYFVVRNILNSKLNLFKDKNIFNLKFYEINLNSIIRNISFSFFIEKFEEIGTGKFGSTFRTYTSKNGKVISFVYENLNSWKCIYNDFYIDKNPERSIDWKEWEPSIPEERNFIHDIIENDIKSDRFNRNFKC